MKEAKVAERDMLKQIEELNIENEELHDKVLKFNQMCERIKEERSNYKNAWDVTDKKFVQSKKNWENEKYEL